jgi:hypothetical protein
MSEQILREIADEAFASDPWLSEAARAIMALCSSVTRRATG